MGLADFMLLLENQPGKADQGLAHGEAVRKVFSLQSFAFSTNNLVMPPCLLLSPASPMLVVSAEAHPAEKFHLVILKLQYKKKDIFIVGKKPVFAMLGENEMLLHWASQDGQCEAGDCAVGSCQLLLTLMD